MNDNFNQFLPIFCSRKEERTYTIKDTHHPVWNHEFTLNNVRLNSNITLIVMDEDKRLDDTLGQIIIRPRTVLESGNNGKMIDYPFGPLNDYITIRLTWENSY